MASLNKHKPSSLNFDFTTCHTTLRSYIFFLFLVRDKIKKKSKSFERTHPHAAVCKIYYFHIYFGSSIKKAQNIFNDCAINEQHKAPDFCTF